MSNNSQGDLPEIFTFCCSSIVMRSFTSGSKDHRLPWSAKAEGGEERDNFILLFYMQMLQLEGVRCCERTDRIFRLNK